MKVIDHEKAATQQIVAQPRGLLLVEVPVADLDGIDPRVVVNIGVERDHDHPLVGRVDGCQPIDAPKEVVLGVRPVGSPGLAAVRARVAVAAVCQAHEFEFAGRRVELVVAERLAQRNAAAGQHRGGDEKGDETVGLGHRLDPLATC